MNTRLSELIKASGQMQLVYKPVFLRITDPLERIALDQLIENQVSFFHDEIYGQLQEMVKMKNPAVRIKPEEYPELIQKHLGGRDIHSYGVWVYYPWSRRLVHMLDEEEFIKVRSNRNQYKITLKEQEILSTKRIGIIGLSVGQSIAFRVAMEGGCGELRRTDFDTVD